MIFNDMIKNWLVNSSEGLDAACSPSPAEEIYKASPLGPTDPQVSFLGLEVSPAVCCPVTWNSQGN
jgi:hypothetical protein